MTTHAHGFRPTIGGFFGRLNRRQRWALVGVPVALTAALLVLTDVVSLSTVLYAGAFGGMMLMHLGGHGSHGGHGDSHPKPTTRSDDASTTGEPDSASGPRPASGAVEHRTSDAQDATREEGSRACH